MECPTLHICPANIVLETASPQRLAWADCIGLRGFIGWVMEQAEPQLRKILLPLFHAAHESPAPFRLLYAGDSESSRQHCFKLISFGPEGPLFHNWLAKLLAGQEGSLRRGQQQLPFRLIDYQTEADFTAFFPNQCPASEGGDADPSLAPRLDTSVFRLSTASPVFLKRNTAKHLVEGTWTQILALRFADLASIPRKSVEALAPAIPIKGRCELEPTPISFGGRPRMRQAGWFQSEPFSVNQDAFDWFKLLIRIGMGAHTAYGAGNFDLEIAENQLRMP